MHARARPPAGRARHNKDVYAYIALRHSIKKDHLYISFQKQIDEVLEEVGLEPETQLRYPHEFSGGQRQRVAIARALILKPEIIIFDEPTSALDVTIQKQVVELLLKLQKRHSLSYMFISHDISLIGMTCHSMMVMKDGKIVERGTTQEILKNPNDAYTKDLISAANRK